jgi:hypothetical protein
METILKNCGNPICNQSKYVLTPVTSCAGIAGPSIAIIPLKFSHAKRYKKKRGRKKRKKKSYHLLGSIFAEIGGVHMHDPNFECVQADLRKHSEK